MDVKRQARARNITALICRLTCRIVSLLLLFIYKYACSFVRLYVLYNTKSGRFCYLDRTNPIYSKFIKIFHEFCRILLVLLGIFIIISNSLTRNQCMYNSVNRKPMDSSFKNMTYIFA